MKTLIPWPPIASAGAAAAWLFVVGINAGGLAQVAVAMVAGAVVGLPIARLFQKYGRTNGIVDASQALRMVIAVSVLGGVLSMSGLPVAYGVVLAGTLWLVSRVLPIPAASAVGLLGIGVTVSAGAAGLGDWTLLESMWSDIGEWWTTSAIVGLLLTGSGGLSWGRDASGRHPAMALGAGLLAAIGMALLLAVDWESGSALPSIVALVLAGGAVLATAGDSAPGRLAIPGVILAMLLAVLPSEAAILIVHTLVPLCIAGLLVWMSRHVTGGDRWLSLVLAIVLIVIAVAAWPGLPESVAASMTVALVPVLGLWVLGPQWVAQRSPA
jgi:hypothetical protein